MDPNSSELPTPPSVPVPPQSPPFQPLWPTPGAGGRPPGQRPPWPLFAAIGAALVVILIIGLLFLTRGGTTTINQGPSANQTATAAGTGSTPTARPYRSRNRYNKFAQSHSHCGPPTTAPIGGVHCCAVNRQHRHSSGGQLSQR